MPILPKFQTVASGWAPPQSLPFILGLIGALIVGVAGFYFAWILKQLALLLIEKYNLIWLVSPPK